MAKGSQHMSQGRQRSRSMADVAAYIKGMRFKRRLFGGVDEADVWRQIELLHKEYESVFLAQELEYKNAQDRRHE